MSSRKSRIPRHLIRYGLVLLGTATAVGCEVVEPDPGLSLSITRTRATVVQGGSQPVTATLTRIGAYSGTVDLTVTGVPSGVTATISNVQATGAVTTATVTIVVDAAVAPAVYPLVVHGSGSGVSEVTQAFTLTVTASPVPGYSLTLTAPTLSIAQGNGGGPPTTTVNLVRTNFTGNVTLSVENLPTGVSTAFFYPDNPISGSSSQLALVVAGNAPTGTFANLLVRGVASGLPDRTAPLSLTITVAPFTLTLSSPTLSIVQGAAPQTTTVNIVRNNFAGPVTLYVDWFDSMPPGVTAAWAPNPATGNSSVLSLAVGAAAVPGVYELYVYGEATTGVFCCVPLTLTVTAP
jgi:hypothetical protein